jgi:5,5'-dehydrodivanillate O-demethylase
MLTEAENRRLTEVTRGTPMGELLRRYWHPVAAVSELDDHPTKPVRIMGEDLVLYRDRGGRYGLIGRHCPHRRADLSYGYVEDCGLRCTYHGWAFDHTGACVDQPFELTINPASRFREQATLPAYPVEPKAGLLWAYLGPEPAPLVPTWEPFTWTNGFTQIVFAEVPCNWFQCQENSIDPVHFEWLHDNWGAVLAGKVEQRAPTHLKLAFDEFDHGFTYRRVRTDTDESNPLWTIGRVCLWPNALFTGDHFEWRVPIDDTNTLSVTWAFERVPDDCVPYAQERIPHWHGPIRDDDGRWITSHVMNQDFVAWCGQGPIADRTQELLGPSDRGIVAIRRRFLEELDAVAAGAEPKAVVRDPAANTAIPLPIIGREQLTVSLTREQYEQRRIVYRRADFPEGYIFQYGQPEAVLREYRAAMGLGREPAAVPSAGGPS